MTNLYELKMGAEKLEALNFLLQSIKELEDAVKDVNLNKMTEIKSDIDKKYLKFNDLLATLETLKKEIAKLSKDGLIDDTFVSSIQTFSSAKITNDFRKLADSYSRAEVNDALWAKLDKSAKAADSDKLDGLDSSSFLQVSQAGLVCQYAHQTHAQVLPDGDYSSSDFWLSITPGIYYAIREIGRNKPTDYGLVEVVSNGEVSVTWNYFGKVWKWYQDYGKANSGWKEVLTGSPTSLSSPNSIVSRDANGDFEARCISAASFKSTANNDDDRMNFQSCIMYWSPDDKFMRPASLARSKEFIYGADFVSIKNPNGYTKLPNGLIIQWGKTSISGKVMLPMAFPNVFLNVTIGNADSQGAGLDVAFGYINDNASFIARTKGGGLVSSDTASSFAKSWIAIGY